MLEAMIRRHYQRWCVDPVVKRLSLRVSPMILTLLSGLIGVCAAICIGLNYTYCALLGLVISGYFDTLDGPLARYQNVATPMGAVLDILMDRIVEVAMIIGLFVIAPATRAWPIMIILTSFYLCITSFLVVGIFSDNNHTNSFYYRPGIIERTEAFIFFGLMMLFPLHFLMLAVLFSSLITITAIKRLVEFSNALTTIKKSKITGLYRPVC